MKAVAIFKWAPNPDDALVRVDGTVNWSTARHDVGDDDHAAMACAMAAAALDLYLRPELVAELKKTKYPL